MRTFNIPTKEQVNESNQAIFNKLEAGLGFVPNLYAFYAHSDTALGDYLNFQNRKSSLSKKETEVINLVVSQYNGCSYCLSAHTAIAKMNGFTDAQILDLRSANSVDDEKYNALAKFTLSQLQNNGKAEDYLVDELFAAGYDQASLVDIAIAIGQKTISNYIHNLTDFAIDFPLAPELETQAV